MLINRTCGYRSLRTENVGRGASQNLDLTALNLLSGKSVRPYLSMTGEINLRGRITIIGGVKEKSIGALCAGVTDVILPEENRKDAEEIPDEVKKKIKYHFVSCAEEAWKVAIPALKKKKSTEKRKKSS